MISLQSFGPNPLLRKPEFLHIFSGLFQKSFSERWCMTQPRKAILKHAIVFRKFSLINQSQWVFNHFRSFEKYFDDKIPYILDFWWSMTQQTGTFEDGDLTKWETDDSNSTKFIEVIDQSCFIHETCKFMNVISVMYFYTPMAISSSTLNRS